MLKRAFLTCMSTLFVFIFSATQLSAAENYVLSGKVVDQNNHGIAGVELEVTHTLFETTTDSQGNFTITLPKALKFKEIELHIGADNYRHISKSISLADGNSEQLTFVLTQSVMEVIDVHATPLHSSTIESAMPINVLSSDELRQKQAATLGKTLQNEVGVHASTYGGVVSSPVIRGLDGGRVLITQNGLDVGDVSRTGADHAISTDSSTAEQIEVLRGPATLFYGSGAIGGVVNVVDNRVPNSNAQNSGFSGDYLAKHSTVNNENEASVNLNYGGENVAVHFDAFARKSDNYDFPKELDLHAHDDHDEEHGEEADGHFEDGTNEEDHEEHLVDHLANSDSKSHGFTLGTSYLFDNGFIGVSYGQLNKEYGVPFHGEHEEEGHADDLDNADVPADEHGDEEINVRGDLEQQRIQLLSEFLPQSDYLKKVSTKVAYNNYNHVEIEDGAVGTTFEKSLFEARSDIYLPTWLGWESAATLHFKNDDFEVSGEEAFTPNATTNALAFAWLQEKHFGEVLVQLGARIEHVTLEAELDLEAHEDEHEEHTGADDVHDDDHAANHGEEHHGDHTEVDFTPVSVSAGAVWEFSQGYNLGLSYSYAERAPSSSELFANGKHIGTSTYDLGSFYELEPSEEHAGEVEIHVHDIPAALETSNSLDIALRKFEGDFGFVFSAFYSRIDNYYFQLNTGYHSDDIHSEEHDHEAEGADIDPNADADEHDHDHGGSLPIYQYQQADVTLYGFEAEAHYQLDPAIKVSLFSDYIRAKIRGGENLPRIPPLRVGAELNYQGNGFDANLAASQYFEQDKTASLEEHTDGYTMVNAHVNYYINGIGDDLVIFAQAENLTNEVAFVHSSFVKDQAPLPGRSFTIGVRGSF